MTRIIMALDYLYGGLALKKKRCDVWLPQPKEARVTNPVKRT